MHLATRYAVILLSFNNREILWMSLSTTNWRQKLFQKILQNLVQV